ncbi:MAG: hypothetical protein QME59_05215 [Candidatus Hydrothermarchaeota archaeon]|nr:hypothetical protein [Candidatus Hydrothermarchaeota archaeon]
MSAVAEKLLSELDKMAEKAKDEETRKEIFDLKIRLQRGSLKGKIKPGPLTYKEKEEALKEYLKERGLKWPGFVD